MAKLIGAVAEQSENRMSVHVTVKPKRVGICAGQDCVAILTADQARELAALLVKAANECAEGRARYLLIKAGVIPQRTPEEDD